MRLIAGILGSLINLAIFGGLAWWVSTEDTALGYIAAGLFGIMALLGAIIIFIMFVFEDKTPPVARKQQASASKGELDTATMAAAMIVSNADQFEDESDMDGGDDYSDDLSDLD